MADDRYPSHAAPARRPTLRDVAEHAGVSFKTVSRVVNGEGGVSEALVRQVENSVAALGYRPDDRARHLRRTATRSGAIGFILVDVANPFFSSILRGIEEVARRRGDLVLAGSTDGDPERERQLIDAFVARRVDGLVVVPSERDVGVLQAELDRGTPVVFLDLEPEQLDVDVVRSDHRGGAMAATRHLLDAGHRDIAFFGDDVTVYSAGLRLDGFRAAMREAGLEVPAHRVVTGRHNVEEWRAVIGEYLRRSGPPTALFTAQNFITLGATYALHDLDLHLRIAQIGFDDVDLAEVVRPAISVVPQHPLELGRRAAELLFRRIDGWAEPVVRDVIASAVVARGSGEIRPVLSR